MNQHIHLIGIGGTGMGPLAKVFLEMGHKVSGSDLQPSETTDYLIKLGATVYFNHSAANVNGATRVIYSSAIPVQNPEIVAARQKGIDVLHRSEVLAQLLNNRRGIAVSGAHGKTTVTSMIALCLEMAGTDPTVLIGAHFAPFGPGAKYGRGEFVVAEADESDGSFLRYRPEVSVVTSIEADHLENYNGTFESLIASYRRFLSNCQPGGLRLIGMDHPVAASISQEYDGVTYGFSPGAHWRAEVLQLEQERSVFRVFRLGEFFADFVLNVPGRHNVSNALACIAVCHHVGLSIPQMQRALRRFTGAKRRFEILGTIGGALVVDDYAHHPTEVAAVIKAAREGWPTRRIVAVFQPHRYSRTKLLFEDFAQAFREADVVIITDIYAPPPEKPIPGVSAAALADRVRESNAPKNVYHIPQQEDVVPFLRDWLTAQDLVLVMGAGPISRVAHDLVKRT
ncbi:MAG: UDP-N-acetylmuramate--L-alanine ligase [Candidatus Darwinibacter acetoxidans]